MSDERREREPDTDPVNRDTLPEEEPPTGFPEPPDREPEEEREPHHELANPAAEPDDTEWPDPFEERGDPKGPERVDTPAMPADEEDEGEAPTGPSTSEPHPPRNPDRERGGKADSGG